ncbi:MAG: YceI family protein [FCB group bacterium]|nr:YceI family protein [FCB group bacterium]
MHTTTLSCLLALTTTLSAGTEYSVDASSAVFAVVTHKAGAVAALAHDHFIQPNAFTVDASAAGDRSQAEFHVKFPVAALQIDDVQLQQKYIPALKKAGIMRKSFTKISDKDRGLVREHMLAEGQLDAEQFPEIEAKLLRLEKKPVKMGETTFEYEAVMALTVRGKTVEHPFGVNVTEEEGGVRIEGAGRYKFTDFGFEPYSGLMGLVRNEDVFYVYADFTATPVK